MSFQRKRNVDILFNIEMAPNKQCFSDFKLQIKLRIGC